MVKFQHHVKGGVLKGSVLQMDNYTLSRKQMKELTELIWGVKLLQLEQI